jgi:hypothetical protein
MHFNRYIFDLYLQASEGKESLKIWTEFLDWEKWDNLDFEILLKQINSSLVLPIVSTEFRIENIKLKENKINSNDSFKLKFTEIREELLTLQKDGFFDKIETNDLKNSPDFNKNLWLEVSDELLAEDKTDRAILEEIQDLSVFLNIFNPHFFFPYFFVSQFYLIENLFREFDLVLPTLPKVRDYKARLNYYFELCEVLYYFRQENEMKPAEFLAFLYGFCGNFIKPKLEESEKPLRVWILRGNKASYVNIKNSKIALCDQSNINVKKSDLILYYFWSPLSSFNIVCKAYSDGFFDPFSYWSFGNLIREIEEIKPISFKDLQEDIYFKNHKLVKARFGRTSSNEYLITNQDYKEFKRLLKSKNQNQDILPELESVVIDTNLDLQNERDVEIQLLEPLLEKLSFSQKDWVRQLPVRMGRGERNYPDYALFVDNKKQHEETAKFLWEAKFRIRNQKELRDAFLQAKSYARRLNSRVFGLCAVEGVWISTLKNHFEFEKIIHFAWKSLEDQENWLMIKKVFEKS